jgi:hypothetical protein
VALQLSQAAHKLLEFLNCYFKLLFQLPHARQHVFRFHHAQGMLSLVGSFWFQTGSGTRKNCNVARDPRCSIAVSILDEDVVAEGEASRVTDPTILRRLAKAWADQGWPAELDETGAGITAPFNAPLHGPPPWDVYRIKLHSVTVVLGTEPGGLTRFRF